MNQRKKQILLGVSSALVGGLIALVSAIAATRSRQPLETHILAGLAVLFCCLTFYTHLNMSIARLVGADSSLAQLNKTVLYLVPMSLSCVPLLIVELLGGDQFETKPSWVITVETIMVSVPSLYACYVSPSIVRSWWLDFSAGRTRRKQLRRWKESIRTSWSDLRKPRNLHSIKQYLSIYHTSLNSQGQLDDIERKYLTSNFSWRLTAVEAKWVYQVNKTCLLCGLEFRINEAAFVGPCCKRMMHTSCLKRHLQASPNCPSFLCKRHYRLSHYQKLQATEEFPLPRFLGIRFEPPKQPSQAAAH